MTHVRLWPTMWNNLFFNTCLFATELHMWYFIAVVALAFLCRCVHIFHCMCILFWVTHHYLEVVTRDDFLPVLHPADGRRRVSCHGTLQLDVGWLIGVRVGRVVEELRRHCKNRVKTAQINNHLFLYVGASLRQCCCCSVRVFTHLYLVAFWDYVSH